MPSPKNPKRRIQPLGLSYGGTADPSHQDMTSPVPAKALALMLNDMAKAIWETWRASKVASENMRDISWDELCELADKYPTRAPAEFHELALQEAEAVLEAMKRHPMVAAVEGAQVYYVFETKRDHARELVGAFSRRQAALDAITAESPSRRINMTLVDDRLDTPISD